MNKCAKNSLRASIASILCTVAYTACAMDNNAPKPIYVTNEPLTENLFKASCYGKATLDLPTGTRVTHDYNSWAAGTQDTWEVEECHKQETTQPPRWYCKDDLYADFVVKLLKKSSEPNYQKKHDDSQKPSGDFGSVHLDICKPRAEQPKPVTNNIQKPQPHLRERVIFGAHVQGMFMPGRQRMQIYQSRPTNPDLMDHITIGLPKVSPVPSGILVVENEYDLFDNPPARRTVIVKSNNDPQRNRSFQQAHGDNGHNGEETIILDDTNVQQDQTNSKKDSRTITRFVAGCERVLVHNMWYKDAQVFDERIELTQTREANVPQFGHNTLYEVTDKKVEELDRRQVRTYSWLTKGAAVAAVSATVGGLCWWLKSRSK